MILNNKNILFTNSNPDRVDSKYCPKPTSKFLPSWYKKIESYFPIDRPKNSDSIESIKACMPVFDTMITGYVITTFCEIEVTFKDGEPTFKSSIPDAIESHPRKQGYLHPNANEFDFPKFLNHWCIKTPKGYSSLFIPLMNNENEYFVPIPGIVDTDNYNNAINFPFVLKDPYKNIVIPAGTPIVQVIPFKRNSWKSIIKEDSNIRNGFYKKLRSSFFGGYKNNFWNKKEYK